jgi:hypothetical protein
MIDDVNNGRTVFYEFYTEQEKKAPPTTSANSNDARSRTFR